MCTFSLKFMSSVYLPVTFQSKVVCISMGLLSFSPMPMVHFWEGSVPQPNLCCYLCPIYDCLCYCLDNILCVCHFLLIILPALKAIVCVFFLVSLLTPCNDTCLNEDNISDAGNTDDLHVMVLYTIYSHMGTPIWKYWCWFINLRLAPRSVFAGKLLSWSCCNKKCGKSVEIFFFILG